MGRVVLCILYIYIYILYLYLGNGCITKHPFINGCLEFQVYIISLYIILYSILICVRISENESLQKRVEFVVLICWHSVKI